MPFTPFHLGPGLAVKAVAGRYFSFTVFAVSQVAIDVEPLVRIARGDDIVHGFTHTYLGATLIALASAVVGRPVCQRLLARWRPGPQFPFQEWLRGDGRISWSAALAGAFVGTYSHVFLDSIMHFDMHPLAPFSPTNALYHAISSRWLHVLCVVSGVLGVLVLYVTHILESDRNKPT